MSEKIHENIFKFGLYQGTQPIVEKIFSADIYNPVIRYSVDIRDMIPIIISKLQKTLSRRNIQFIYDIGNGKSYDLLSLYKKTLDIKVEGYENKLSKPIVVNQFINKKTITGVECKFGLYINENPIVERNFYVDNYNPASRFSTDIIEVVNEIVDDINLSLKTSDVNHMWADYDLIKVYGIYIHQIRELPRALREEMIKKIKNSGYVKNIKSQLRKGQIH